MAENLRRSRNVYSVGYNENRSSRPTSNASCCRLWWLLQSAASDLRRSSCLLPVVKVMVMDISIEMNRPRSFRKVTPIPSSAYVTDRGASVQLACS